MPTEVVTLRRGEDGELLDEHEDDNNYTPSSTTEDILARAMAEL